MKLFQMVGFSLGEADIIRRAMSKKHLNEIEAAKSKFVEGLIAKGADPEDVEEFWQRLLKFASYAFNKAHARVYSITSYHTAYLKGYYFPEYMAALISYTTKDEVEKYVSEVREKGYKLLPPSINKSKTLTFVDNNGCIRFGLEAIANVAKSASVIVSEREKRGVYTSFENFYTRCFVLGVDKSAFESLVLSSACDEFHIARAEMLFNIENNYKDFLTTKIKTLKKETPEITTDEIIEKLLEMLKSGAYPERIRSADYSDIEKLRFEEELLGFFATSDPLEKYADVLKKNASYTVNSVRNLSIGNKEASISGIITNLKQIKIKRDGSLMCKFTLTDSTSSISVIVFPRVYQKYAANIKNGDIISVRGRINDAGADNIEFSAAYLKILV